MCTKVCYANRRDARSAARWLARHGCTAQHAYRCERCGHWHLSSMSRAAAKRTVKARRRRRDDD